MFLRPIRSDVEDQPIRPSMLAAESSATNPAAADAETGVEVSAKKSVIIGAAFSRMPIPAVTFMQSTTHRHQNWGVRMALFAETCTPSSGAGPPSAAVFAGRGTRTSSTPSDMKTAYVSPCTRNACAIPVLSEPKDSSICADHGEAISAPPPNPMMAMPVAMPGLSGNHLMSVETGEM
jgi:hypothetical protein